MTLLAVRLPAELQSWLSAHAESLDTCADSAHEVLPRLAASGLLGVGVPRTAGGVGGDAWDAVEVVTAVARTSLAAAFMLWGQRAFMDYLLQGDAPDLRARLLPELLSGRLAGATGLSNAMKFLAAIEQLQMHAQPCTNGTDWHIDGTLPWVTNLDPAGFVVAAAVTVHGQRTPAVVALESRLPGIQRSPDLALLGLRGSHTAAIQAHDVHLPEGAVIAHDGPRFLCQVRPNFLAMQCGLSFGLIQATLSAARDHARPVLLPRLDALETSLLEIAAEMRALLNGHECESDPTPLFRLRVQLAHLVLEALPLELMATGGRAYLVDQTPGFARRWREAAFIPIVTPSLTQLQTALSQATAGTCGTALP